MPWYYIKRFWWCRIEIWKKQKVLWQFCNKCQKRWQVCLKRRKMPKSENRYSAKVWRCNTENNKMSLPQNVIRMLKDVSNNVCVLVVFLAKCNRTLVDDIFNKSKYQIGMNGVLQKIWFRNEKVFIVYSILMWRYDW